MDNGDNSTDDISISQTNLDQDFSSSVTTPSIVYHARNPSSLIEIRRIPSAQERKHTETTNAEHRGNTAWDTAMDDIQAEQKQAMLKDLSLRIRASLRPLFQQLRLVMLFFFVNLMLWVCILVLSLDQDWRKWAVNNDK